MCVFLWGMWLGRWWHVLVAPSESCRKHLLGDLLDLLHRSHNLGLRTGCGWFSINGQGEGEFAGLVQKIPRVRELQRQNWKQQPLTDGPSQGGIWHFQLGEMISLRFFFFFNSVFSTYFFTVKETGSAITQGCAAAFPPWRQNNLALFDFHYAFQWIWDVIN